MTFSTHLRGLELPHNACTAADLAETTRLAEGISEKKVKAPLGLPTAATNFALSLKLRGDLTILRNVSVAFLMDWLAYVLHLARPVRTVLPRYFT